MLKTCSQCKAEKPLEDFSKDARRKDGLNLSCKPCRKAYIAARKAKKGESSTYLGAPCKNGHKGLRLRTSGNCVECLDEWRQANKDKLAAQVRERYRRNPEKFREAGRKWRAANPGASAANSRAYAEKNRERLREKNREWREANKEYALAKNRAYWHANKERLKQRHKEWAAANAEALKAKQKEAYRRRRQDFDYVQKDRARAKAHFEQNKGYYFIKSKIRRGLVAQATPKWLTTEDWERINKVYVECNEVSQATGIPHEVDHIVPLRGETVSGLHVPWNLQILTAEENRAKGAKHD